MTRTPQHLMTPDDVAARLGASRRHIHHLIDAGLLPAIDLGLGARRVLRIASTDVEDFVAARAVAPRRDAVADALAAMGIR